MSEKSRKSDRLLGRGGLIFLFSLAAAVPFFQLGPWVEARLAPVTTLAEIHDEEVTSEGVSFYVSFTKLRQCDFIGVAWYNGPMRVGVEFEPNSHLYPQTRPEGDQYAGPWLVRGVTTLEGTRALALHRCHPFWTTITPFYG